MLDYVVVTRRLQTVGSGRDYSRIGSIPIADSRNGEGKGTFTSDMTRDRYGDYVSRNSRGIVKYVTRWVETEDVIECFYVNVFPKKEFDVPNERLEPQQCVARYSGAVKWDQRAEAERRLEAPSSSLISQLAMSNFQDRRGEPWRNFSAYWGA